VVEDLLTSDKRLVEEGVCVCLVFGKTLIREFAIVGWVVGGLIREFAIVGWGGGFDKQRANVIWCCRVAQMLGARAQQRVEEGCIDHHQLQKFSKHNAFGSHRRWALAA